MLMHTIYAWHVIAGRQIAKRNGYKLWKMHLTLHWDRADALDSAVARGVWFQPEVLCSIPNTSTISF